MGNLYSQVYFKSYILCRHFRFLTMVARERHILLIASIKEPCTAVKASEISKQWDWLPNGIGI